MDLKRGSLFMLMIVVVEAWHAATGKIPIRWTEAAMGAGVGRSEYEKWLRWYGKKIRNGLWWRSELERATYY